MIIPFASGSLRTTGLGHQEKPHLGGPNEILDYNKKENEYGSAVQRVIF